MIRTILLPRCNQSLLERAPVRNSFNSALNDYVSCMWTNIIFCSLFRKKKMLVITVVVACRAEIASLMGAVAGKVLSGDATKSNQTMRVERKIFDPIER